ncbi:MAG TPA: hypothetical protein PKO40_01750, partial [Dokdonella sp.]|uniref:hypothetical protein n=1 Tax=Dokdonella sp. TaxID=2291710 RepID=UPI002CBC66CE
MAESQTQNPTLTRGNTCGKFPMQISGFAGKTWQNLVAAQGAAALLEIVGKDQIPGNGDDHAGFITGTLRIAGA